MKNKKEEQQNIKKYNIYINVSKETEKKLEFLSSSFAQKINDYNFKYRKNFFLFVIEEYKNFLEEKGIYEQFVFDQEHTIKIYTHKRKDKDQEKRNLTVGAYETNEPIILFKNIVYNIQKQLGDINDINEAVSVLLAYIEANLNTLVEKYKNNIK